MSPKKKPSPIAKRRARAVRAKKAMSKQVVKSTLRTRAEKDDISFIVTKHTQRIKLNCLICKTRPKLGEELYICTTCGNVQCKRHTAFKNTGIFWRTLNKADGTYCGFCR